MAYENTSRRITRGWRSAMYRGAALGGVASLHLAFLILLLQLPSYRAASLQPRTGESLRIRFLALPARPPSVRHTAPAATKPPPSVPRPVIAANTRSADDSSAPSSPTRIANLTTPTIHAMPSDYQPGSFHADLRAAQGSRKVPLPGLDAPSRTGIRLRDRPSMKEVVHAMTVASRCKYSRMKMQRSATQFVTPQLMQRALDADGCGPQLEHTPADATIEAVSREAIFGD